MGQSAEELRREIENNRENLGSTVDAIGDRVSPGRMVERRTNRVKGSFRSAKESVMGTTSDVTGTVGDRVSSAAARATAAPQVAKDAATSQAQGHRWPQG